MPPKSRRWSTAGKRPPPQAQMLHSNLLDQNDAVTIGETLRKVAVARNRAIIAVVIPLADGSGIGEVMSVERFGPGGLPRCRCEDFTDRDGCVHMENIYRVLHINHTHPERFTGIRVSDIHPEEGTPDAPGAD